MAGGNSVKIDVTVDTKKADAALGRLERRASRAAKTFDRARTRTDKGATQQMKDRLGGRGSSSLAASAVAGAIAGASFAEDARLLGIRRVNVLGLARESLAKSTLSPAAKRMFAGINRTLTPVGKAVGRVFRSASAVGRALKIAALKTQAGFQGKEFPGFFGKKRSLGKIGKFASRISGILRGGTARLSGFLSRNAQQLFAPIAALSLFNAAGRGTSNFLADINAIEARDPNATRFGAAARVAGARVVDNAKGVFVSLAKLSTNVASLAFAALDIASGRGGSRIMRLAVLKSRKFINELTQGAARGKTAQKLDALLAAHTLAQENADKEVRMVASSKADAALKAPGAGGEMTLEAFTENFRLKLWEDGELRSIREAEAIQRRIVQLGKQG